MKNDDKELHDSIRREIHDAPVNEWLTRRVVNRLPQRRMASSWIEKLAYFISGVLLVVSAVLAARQYSFSLVSLVIWISITATLIAVVSTIVADKAAAVSRPIERESRQDC